MGLYTTPAYGHPSRWEFAPELVLNREIKEWESEIVDDERDLGRGRGGGEESMGETFAKLQYI